MFPRVHAPGEAAQSEFTHMISLDVTFGGVPFEHLVFHLVLVYSNSNTLKPYRSASAMKSIGSPSGQTWGSFVGRRPSRVLVLGLDRAGATHQPVAEDLRRDGQL